MWLLHSAGHLASKKSGTSTPWSESAHYFGSGVARRPQVAPTGLTITSILRWISATKLASHCLLRQPDDGYECLLSTSIPTINDTQPLFSPLQSLTVLRQRSIRQRASPRPTPPQTSSRQYREVSGASTLLSYTREPPTACDYISVRNPFCTSKHTAVGQSPPVLLPVHYSEESWPLPCWMVRGVSMWTAICLTIC